MKAVVSIVFTLIIFFSSLLPSHNLSELSQWSQIHNHYLLHLQSGEDQSLGFWHFFWMHYSPFSNSHDLEHDHDLPLFNQITSLDYVNGGNIFKLPDFSKVIELPESSKYFNHYHFLFVNQLLHPPKF